ncbi:uncharacterized protein LOC116206576 [Punica granatum]|uniref:EF-hand domain-containing protein n=2 Tax=Punica granatum TaxID=22663 RepID=A0A218XAQ0_PUNGR|nr:uncharacterized protein LOC116206576 [Punica granatum]OWM82037.1 hypothetical protein CDL15_Pgr001611 [Punica granatum]PKI44791.1 hypothetical protein CRG98_034739 [Punica granatum]
MSNGGGLTVLDGSELRASDFNLGDNFSSAITGAQVIGIAETNASVCLYGISLPESLRRSALNRIGVSDVASFSTTQLEAKRAMEKIKDYVNAIADHLDDDPIVATILDGSTLRLYLEDEDDFAVLAEDLFTDLDAEDKGKIRKKEILNALDRMGAQMGIPPRSELPLIDDILKKHGAEGEEEVGQAQFAQILQPVLQELVDYLSEKPIVLAHNVKVANGSRIRKFLENEKELASLTEKMWQSRNEGTDGQGTIEPVRTYLEKFGKELGLPPSKVDESAALYDSVFDVVAAPETVGRDEFGELVKGILGKFAQQLDANPVFYDPEE